LYEDWVLQAGQDVLGGAPSPICVVDGVTIVLNDFAVSSYCARDCYPIVFFALNRIIWARLNDLLYPTLAVVDISFTTDREYRTETR
jgi:hypothetical protein